MSDPDVSCHRHRPVPCQRNLYFLVLATLLATSTASAAGVEPDGAIDTSQTELMLTFLESTATGQAENNALAAVLASPGTDLVIEQMNLMRRVTREQYERVLRNVVESEAPFIEPADDSERSARGLIGLTDNVWPVLRWGRGNTELLRQRLEEIRTLEVFDAAKQRAEAFLPAPVEISPRVFIVMGGRAGAAALSEGRIYVDLLLLSYLDHLGHRPYLPEADLVDFIAHEMHHLALAKIRANHRTTLDLEGGEGLAYRLLSSIVSEGSATYLISGHRDLTRAVSSLGSAVEPSAQGEELLRDCERVLRAIQSGEIVTREHFDAATAFLLGSGAHLTGTIMLGRIDQQSGLDAVMSVLADPRRLLTEFNDATDAMQPSAGKTLFDSELAVSTAALGHEKAPR